jgi:hypothetical protein
MLCTQVKPPQNPDPARDALTFLQRASELSVLHRKALVEALRPSREAFHALARRHASFAFAIACRLGERLRDANDSAAQGLASAPAGSGVEELRVELGIYLPRVAAPAERDAVAETLALFGQLFGGATCSDARGTWASPSGGLVEDELCIVRSFTTEARLRDHLPHVLEHAEALKRTLWQEALAIEIRGRLLIL